MTCMSRSRAAHAFVATLIAALALTIVPRGFDAPAAREGALPERVQFQSADGKTMLVGYLFKPSGETGKRVPAVVMMHGRAGAYSSRANGVYDVATLSLRHKF